MASVRTVLGEEPRSPKMKITEIRTRVVQWKGKTVPLPPHFCTNPMDVISPMLSEFPSDCSSRRESAPFSQHERVSGLTSAATSLKGAERRGKSSAGMRTFTFHGWLICEVFTDNGLVGIGNAALAPNVTKQLIDLYLKPLLIGADPWDTEFLWQHMYRKTMAFGRKGIALVAISAVDIALWDLLGKSAKQPVYRLLGGRTKPRIPVYASRLYSTPLKELAREAMKYKKEGYQAMKLRFGWGPVDGAEGMQKNVALVRTVREAIGDGIDIMADAYMGWNLDYAKRMLPLLEKFNLRWLEEPVIPDDGQMHNYHVVMASLNSPMAEFFPPVEVEAGNELFWYLFKGEPTPKDGFIDLDENVPGLGLTVDEKALKKFK